MAAFYVATSTSGASHFPYASTTALTVSGTAYFAGSGIWNSSGNVGIGTASPSQKLHVVGSELLGASGSLYFNDTGTAIGIPAANTLAFTTSALERMRIDNSGNVGIGSTTPYGKLTEGFLHVSADRTLVCLRHRGID